MAHHLDNIDLGILRHLQKDSNITKKELSIIFNRSMSVISHRIGILETLGIIKGYKAVVDYQKFNDPFISYTIIKVNNHSGDALNDLERDISKLDEVVELSHITGNFDFFIKVVVTNMRTYNDFVRLKLSTIPNVGKVLTSTVISEKKRITEYPIE